MKIAAVSDEGVTISQHFGRAPFYVVVTVEAGQVFASEKRYKVGHVHFAAEPHCPGAHVEDPPPHGFDPAAPGPASL